MSRILITGAKGQLGKALTLLLKDKKPYELLLTGHTPSEDGSVAKLDIADETAVNNTIKRVKPDIIINCATMTAVDLCESEQENAYRVNSQGAKYLAQAAAQIDAKLIQVSTDYVFDGKKKEPYIESDATNPLNVYGTTKLQGELFVLEHCKKSMIVRTAWLYGEGKNFVKTMLRLADSGNKIRVVADQFGTPTSTIELAKTIIYLMETEAYGIYHATCEGSCSWYEFAEMIFQVAGKDVKVEAITTAEYKTPAQRPLYSVLDNKALRERHGYYMKDWKVAFTDYMQEFFI